MRLLPSNLAEAKEWAKALHDQLVRYNIPLMPTGKPGSDGSSRPPTLQQTQNIMANSLGYDGWFELSRVASTPHEPVYRAVSDGTVSIAMQRRLFKLELEAERRLAGEFGVPELTRYMQDAWLMAFVGYSAADRKALAGEYISDREDMDNVYESEIFADGVWSTKVAGVTGTELSPQRQAMMPVHLRLPRPFYPGEGMTDWTLPLLAFPDEMPDTLVDALHSLGLITADGAAREGALADLDPKLAATATYLAQCVARNVRPVAEPTTASGRPGADLPTGEAVASSVTDAPTLDDWCRALMTAEKEGLVPFGPAPWMKHFGYWERRLGDRLR